MGSHGHASSIIEVALEHLGERLGHATLREDQRAVDQDQHDHVRYDAPLLRHDEPVDRFARLSSGQVAREHPVEP